jgi:hypothetical protein
MKFFLILMLSVVLIFTGCEKEHSGLTIDPRDSLFFNGLFVTSAYYGEVTLLVDKGCYEFNTSLPNGHGAGKLEVKDEFLEFRDTLDLPILHVYGYAFVPRGKYYYRYDGKKLEIQKYMSGGKIMYELFLMNQ